MRLRSLLPLKIEKGSYFSSLLKGRVVWLLSKKCFRECRKLVIAGNSDFKVGHFMEDVFEFFP